MREASVYFSDEMNKTILPEFLSRVKNLRTRTEYYSYICILCDNQKKDFLDLTITDAQLFMSYMTARYHNGTLSRKTINVRLSCYSTLSKYIAECYPELSFENPFRDIIRPKVDDSVCASRIPTLTEMDAILSESKNHPPYYVILALASRTALSATNIIRMTKNNLVEENGRLFICYESANDKKSDLIVCLPKDVEALLRKHIEELTISDEKKHLFFNEHKRPMTLTNLDSGVKRIVKACDIENTYTIKDIRSRAILEMKKAGADDQEIARYTGLTNQRIRSFANASGLIGDCPADLVNYQLKEA